MLAYLTLTLKVAADDDVVVVVVVVVDDDIVDGGGVGFDQCRDDPSSIPSIARFEHY